MTGGFVEPSNLWALVVPVLVALLLVFSGSRRQRMGQLLGLSLERLSVALWVSVFCLALLVIALCRPYYGKEIVKIPLHSADLVAIVDVSRSMLATDVSPNRLGFVKRKLIDLLKLLRERGTGDRLGLILFAGESYVFCPLTPDYDVLKQFIGAIDTELFTAQGSNIQAAFEEARRSFANGKAQFPQLLLFSDGEDFHFDIEHVVEKLKELSPSIDIFAVGTSQGAPMKMRNGRFVGDGNNHAAITRLNAENLKKLASELGGTYHLSSLDDSDLQDALSHRPVNLSSGSTSREWTNYRELGPWIVIFVLLICLVNAHSRKVILPSVLVCLICTADYAFAESEDRLLYESSKLLSDGKLGDAENAYHELLEKNPESFDGLSGIATIAERRGELEKAINGFERALEHSSNDDQKFQALYNLGTMNLRSGKIEEAESYLSQALALRPRSEEASFNRDLARRKKRETPTPTPNPDESPSPSPSESPTSSPSPQQSPSASPSESPSHSPSPSPSSSPSSSSSPSQSSTPKPSGSPNASPSGSGSPSPNGSPRGSPSTAPSPSSSMNPLSTPNRSGSSRASPTPASLSEAEARQWLDSLPDAPVLLRRKIGEAPEYEDRPW